MNRAEGIAFLNREGNLAVPGGRYGWDTESCSPIAWDLAEVIADANGDPVTKDELESCMGLVVNSHDDVAFLLDLQD